MKKEVRMEKVQDYAIDDDLLDLIGKVDRRIRACIHSKYNDIEGKQNVLEIRFRSRKIDQSVIIQQQLAWVDYGEEEQESQAVYTSFCEEFVTKYRRGILPFSQWQEEKVKAYKAEAPYSTKISKEQLQKDYAEEKDFYDSMKKIAEEVMNHLLPPMIGMGFVKDKINGEVMTGTVYQEKKKTNGVYVFCNKAGEELVVNTDGST